MAKVISQIALVLMFAIGVSLFIYGATDLKNGITASLQVAGTGGGYTTGFAWALTGRHMMALGGFLASIPVGIKILPRHSPGLS